MDKEDCDIIPACMPRNLILRKNIQGPGNRSKSTSGKSKAHGLLLLLNHLTPTYSQQFAIGSQQLFVKVVISNLPGKFICMCVCVNKTSFEFT